MQLHGLLKNIYLLIVLSFATLLLSSCSHTSKQDGAPDFHIDETKIPNAVPRHEPLAKYGNMPSYVVFGKRYYTMKSCQNYEATGTASWYGTKFHSKRTSSGEPYNLSGMTAAHKTLPLPTYVEVTNLKNNRTIIVKVNDRGPFESNRLIDLSYVAAKKLGMLGHGTAQVKIRALSPNSSPTPLVAENNSSAFNIPNINTHIVNGRIRTETTEEQIYLQVGVFRNKQYAENLQNRLTHLLNVPVRISAKQNSLYHVKIGPIKDSVTSTRLSIKLKELGIASSKLSDT